MTMEHTPTPQWSFSINYGPDEEQNYANVYDAAERLVGNLRMHHANAVVAAVNSYASSQAEIARLRGVLQDLHAFVSIMVGRGADAAIPETIDTPLGVPVKIGAIMRDAAAAIAAQAQS